MLLLIWRALCHSSTPPPEVAAVLEMAPDLPHHSRFVDTVGTSEMKEHEQQLVTRVVEYMMHSMPETVKVTFLPKFLHNYTDHPMKVCG